MWFLAWVTPHPVVHKFHPVVHKFAQCNNSTSLLVRDHALP
jgi:hypothetical protein